MSVFSKISLSRKAAKEHKAKVAEKEPDPDVKVPYKHVPTHAAVDALNGAPSTWRVDDRSKIKEHHKRRSEMTTSRTTSALSIATTSYLNSAAGPALEIHLCHGIAVTTLTTRHGLIEAAIVILHMNLSKRNTSHLEVIHITILALDPVLDLPLWLRTCTAKRAADVTPALSSGNSDTSDSSDNLEISVAPNQNYHIPQRPVSIRVGSHHQSANRMSLPQGTVFPDKDIFSRLHTSTTRKLGEAPLYDSPPVLRKAPTPTVNAVEQTSKKSRWSLLGKKRNANTVA
ncbi:hypothetical protein LOCC1_G001166 [Lachnellula occidentalis]|uniref:Uncharacterized protein n=1 Tax=Lachnellula occidentalis TaxID=215460 RepID=A0A8H8S6T8_9HELO|nr:hypothetical protein LOCC1_G001166 [Lachnellula occidentalis]